VSLTDLVRCMTALTPRQLLAHLVVAAEGRVCASRQRRRDARSPTYAPGATPPPGPLGRYFQPLPLDVLRPHREAVAGHARRVMAHRFDLLGSGPVQVRHGMSCPGLRGWRYHAGAPIRADAHGDWLCGRVNRVNLETARRVWRLVSDRYVPIDWSLDFVSGYRWPETTWYKDVTYATHRGADVKIPWELARMQHLPPLAWAFALAQAGESGFEAPGAYRREFQDQVADFVATSPPRFGVNWTSTMDVALRVANWLVAYDLFRAYGAAFDQGFEACLRRSVYEHGRHILGNLEWGPTLRANHYLANVVGLLFVAAYLPGTDEGDAWLRFAVAELVGEVGGQFGRDGGNFEGSTSYHRLSAEMVAYATALVLALPPSKQSALWACGVRAAGLRGPIPPARRSGPALGGGSFPPFPAWYRERLERMAAFTAALSSPGGRVSQFGDNDSGRFLKLWAPAPAAGGPAPDDAAGTALDHRHLVAVLNAFADRADFAAFAGNAGVEAEVIRRLAGEEALGRFRAATAPPASGPPRAAAGHFPDFGAYVLHAPPLRLVVRCGPVGQNGNGGHAHNDQLSFELLVNGVPLLVDLGTYVYTPLPEERNRFRSTASHNTLVAGGCEQNPWRAGRQGLFSLRDRARAQVRRVTAESFVGEHRGFGPVHRRSLRVGPGYLDGVDECRCRLEKKVLFHLAPAVAVTRLVPNDGVELAVDGGGVKIESAGGDWSVAEAEFSPGYGVLQRTRVCRLCSGANVIRWRIRVLGG
jgi:Heparinase II/III-like protein/Heparinase II/III N-terminus